MLALPLGTSQQSRPICRWQRASPNGARPSARVLVWVKSAILTASRSIPVYPDKQTFSEPVGMSQKCQLQTYNFADDAAGESKRVVLGPRWLGGTLHAEAGRSCTVRRRLIGVGGRIYDRLGGDVPPHWIILNEQVPTDSCYSDVETQDKKGN